MTRLPTERFSDRVEDYILYRPSYPQAVVELLIDECGLSAGSDVADIGSGPGNLATLLLPIAHRVYGVEPNEEMRRAGGRLLAGFANFKSLTGTAEETGLPEASVDLVTAAQAFHWFKREAARREFVRIIRPAGWVVLIWNTRLTKETAFLRDYESLLHSSSAEYASVNHANIGDAEVAAFFAPSHPILRKFENKQVFDFDGLRGRALSSSYVPNQGEPRERFLSSLEEIFNDHQVEGRVEFLYETEVYCGRLSG